MKVISKVKFNGCAGKLGNSGNDVEVEGIWNFVARRADGSIKWEETVKNRVVNQGLDHLLDVALSGATQITTWYVGLLSATPTVAAGDTIGSHAGWTEIVAYDEATRPEWTDAGVSGQSVSNSASPATFTIDTNATGIGGAFLISDSEVGGAGGTLYAAAAFTLGNKTLDDNETLDVTCTFTMAAAV